MKPIKVSEIMQKVLKVWLERVGGDPAKLDSEKIKETIKMLLKSPHEDGFQRVANIENPGINHLVPFEDIILNGLKGWEIEKYPIENKNE